MKVEYKKRIKKINYVVTNFLGERRFAPSLKEDVLFFIKQHIQFLNDNKISSIKKVTFVLNKCNDSERDNKFIEYINNLEMDVEFELIVRENKGFSYGAWQEVVAKNTEFDYHFLIEDDYVPTSPKFIDYFMEQMKENTVYVCCIFERGHCAMSSGLLNNKIVKNETRLDADKILNVTNFETNDYIHGVDNQRNFMLNFIELGYEINDLSETNRWLFLNHIGNISQHGNLEGEVLLKPLDVNYGKELIEAL